MTSKHAYRVIWHRDRWSYPKPQRYRYFSRRGDVDTFVAKLTDPNSLDGPVDFWEIQHSPADWQTIASSSDTNQGRLEL